MRWKDKVCEYSTYRGVGHKWTFCARFSSPKIPFFCERKKGYVHACCVSQDSLLCLTFFMCIYYVIKRIYRLTDRFGVDLSKKT